MSRRQPPSPLHPTTLQTLQINYKQESRVLIVNFCPKAWSFQPWNLSTSSSCVNKGRNKLGAKIDTCPRARRTIPGRDQKHHTPSRELTRQRERIMPPQLCAYNFSYCVNPVSKEKEKQETKGKNYLSVSSYFISWKKELQPQGTIYHLNFLPVDYFSEAPMPCSPLCICVQN